MRRWPPLTVVCCGLLCTATLALHLYIRAKHQPGPTVVRTPESERQPLPAQPDPAGVAPAPPQPAPATPDEREQATVLKLRPTNSATIVNWSPVRSLPTLSVPIGEEQWTYEAKRLIQFRVIHSRSDPKGKEPVESVLAEVPELIYGNLDLWGAIPDQPEVVRGRVRLCWPAPYRSGWLTMESDKYGLGAWWTFFEVPGSPRHSEEVAAWLKWKGWPGGGFMSYSSFGASGGKDDNCIRDKAGKLRHPDSEALIAGKVFPLQMWGTTSNGVRLVVRAIPEEELQVLRGKRPRPAPKP